MASYRAEQLGGLREAQETNSQLGRAHHVGAALDELEERAGLNPNQLADPWTRGDEEEF